MIINDINDLMLLNETSVIISDWILEAFGPVMEKWTFGVKNLLGGEQAWTSNWGQEPWHKMSQLNADSSDDEGGVSTSYIVSQVQKQHNNCNSTSEV